MPSSSSPRASQQSNGLRGRPRANGSMGPSESPGFITTPHTLTHNTAPLPKFDPLMLLQPGKAQAGRAMAAQPAAGRAHPKPSMAAASPMPQFQFTSASSMDGDEETSTADGDPSQMQILDRMHRTEERSQRSQRRRKRSTSPTDSDTSKSSRTNAWSRSGGGSMISQHLKEQRKELQSAQDQNGRSAEDLKQEIEASLMQKQSGRPNGTKREELVDLTRDMVDLTEESPIGAAQQAVDLTDDSSPGLRAGTVDLTEEGKENGMRFYVSNGRKFYFDETKYEETEVCYGRIEGARLNIHAVPNNGRQVTNRSEWPPMTIKLQRASNRNTNIIKAYDPTGADFGNLDPRTSGALKSYLDSPVYRLRMEARTDSRPKKPFEAPGQATSGHITVYINLFGPRKYAIDPIGRGLSQQQVWLRTPKMMPPNKELFNPHCTDPAQAKMAKKAAAKMTASLTALSSSSGFRSRTVEEAQQETQSLFNSLPNHEDLPRLDPDPNVVSDLLDHQKQALYWMVQRETPIKYEPGEDTGGTLWRCRKQNGRTVWHHVITCHEISERPRDMLGGLLADMMGLGKTLSVLSLLSYTRPEALEFASNAPQAMSPHHPGIKMRNIKTTLLICPVSVISNWEEQIMQHIRENGLTYYPYHGPTRNKSLDFLEQFDVILTSYPVVKFELFPLSRSTKPSAQSPLVLANFYRVVLDEAHIIRNPSTQQFNACCQVQADRRWALTATPVQNKLDDFGAIVRFLGCFPFDVNGMFAQFILSPFKIADPAGVKNLRLLVDTITLRRLKDRIDLTPRRDETIYLSFNEEEQALYNFFASDASKRLSAISASAGTKARLQGKGFMNILRSILCLRQICAHGKDLLKDSDMKLIEGQSSNSAIDVEVEDTRPPLDEHNAYSVFDLLTETNAASCISCNKRIVALTPELDDDEDEVFCTMMPCYQILCTSCFKEVDKTARQKVQAGADRMECPFCDQAWRISFCNITSHGLWRAARVKEDLRNEPKKARMLNRYEGPSTKTIQLILKLKETMLESKPLEDKGEMPIKSVVFSTWTSHLELIGIALDNEKIKYVSMVGSMLRKQRREALNEFRDSKTCNVLLVSIGTGGVGLNLTAASRVYLMDIGFNPMAEQQAIDRVHRLGQTRDVIFTRFLMHKSIEVRILELQKRKIALADLSLQNNRKMDRDEVMRHRLQELQSLFK